MPDIETDCATCQISKYCKLKNTENKFRTRNGKDFCEWNQNVVKTEGYNSFIDAKAGWNSE